MIGAGGFIGRHLWDAFQQAWPGSVGTGRGGDRRLYFLDLAAPDLDRLAGALDGHAAAVICAAESRIDRCQADPESTAAVNVVGTLAVIRRLWQAGILPVFLSSDQVFDGQAVHVLTENDPVAPQNVYGRQKARVEQALGADGRPFLALRLSKVFGTDPDDGSFLTATARDLLAGRPVRAALDLVFNPVWIADVVTAVGCLLAQGHRGLFHLCGAETWSRYELAVALARHLGLGAGRVEKIHLADLAGAPRPGALRLSGRRLYRAIGWRPTPMDACLATIAAACRRTGGAA